MAFLINTLARQSSRCLPLLRGSSYAFSSSACTRAAIGKNASFSHITDLLTTEADKQAAGSQKNAPPQKTLGNRLRTKQYAPGQNSQYAQYNGPRFKPLGGVHWVSPHNYTYENRSRPQKSTKRYAVGPSAKASKDADVFYQAGIDPLAECMNTTLMSYFVTEMGKIKGRAETKLTWRSQRRLGKAIRTAKMMGLIPMFSKRGLVYPKQWGNVVEEDNRDK